MVQVQKYSPGDLALMIEYVAHVVNRAVELGNLEDVAIVRRSLHRGVIKQDPKRRPARHQFEIKHTISYLYSTLKFPTLQDTTKYEGDI